MSNIILGTFDVGGEGQAVLLAAVNAALASQVPPPPRALTADDVEFLDPELVSTPDPLRNSVIKMAPSASSGFYGVRRIFYNRIHVSDLGVISVPRASAVNVSDLLTDISYKYGILIKPEDIYDAVLPPPVQGVPNVEVNLNFRPTSVLYYGETKIILGNNDPSGGNTGGSTLFVPVQTLFGWDAEEAGGGPKKVDVFSTTIDQDKNRKRMGVVQDNTASVENIVKRIWSPSNIFNAEQRGGFPVVGTWRAASGAVRALDFYGSVLEKDATSTGWGEALSQVLDRDFAVENDLLEVQATSPIKGLVQALDGKVYVLVNDGTPQILVSADDGVTWTEVTGWTNSPVLMNAGTWGDETRIFDMLHHAGRIWVLYRADDSTAPAVESYDVTTKDVTKQPLAPQAKSSTLTLNLLDSKKIAFSIPTPGMLTPTVVAVMRLQSTEQPLVWLFTSEGATYQANAVNHGLLDRDFINDPRTYVSGHSQEIVKNANWRLDAIELGTSVATETANTEFASLNQVRELEKYKTYGVVALSSIANATGRTRWLQTNVVLGATDYPRPMRLQSLGRCGVWHLQPENALARITYTESSTVGGFVAGVDNSVVIEKSSQFRKVLPFGSASFTKPAITESTFTNYVFEGTGNDDNGKPDINFSFVGKNATTSQWLTAAAINTALLRRSVGFSNAPLGEPLALATMGSDLYFLSSNQMLFKSTDLGKNWAAYSDARTFYQDDGTTTGRSLASYAAVPLVSSAIKSGALHSDIIAFEVDYTTTAKVYDKTLKNLQASRVLTTHTVLRVAPGDVNTSGGYTPNGPFSSYGINYAGHHQPLQIAYWYAEFGTNEIKARVKRTESETAPLAETEDTIMAQAVIPNGWVVTDVKRDVLYLDIKEVVTAHNADGSLWRLYVLDKNDATYEIDLFGGTKPANAGFKPDVSFYMWDHQDTNYVPLVYYTDKAVLFLDRLTEDGLFADRVRLLTVPDDNGATLRPIPMLSKNRRDYWFYQKGNGIFKLNYIYNPVNRDVTMQLVRQFSLATPGLNDIDIHTGSVGGTVAVPPTVPLIPVFPPNGQFISYSCNGTTKVGTYHDGNGGTYQQDMETNSVDCGYNPPTPGPVGANSAVVTVNTANNNQINTTTTAFEGAYAYILYELDEALADDTDVDLSVSYGLTSAGDFDSFEVMVDNNTWTPVAITNVPTTVTIPAGTTQVLVRIKPAEDATAEGNENYKFYLQPSAGNTQLTNGLIETQMTIRDPLAVGVSMVTLRPHLAGPNVDGFTTSVEVDEDDVFFVVYDISPAMAGAQSAAASFNITSTEAGLGDLEALHVYDIGGSAWVPLSLNSPIPLATGQNRLAIRVKIYADDTLEGQETMQTTLTIAGTANTDAGTVVHSVVVHDTSNGFPQGPAAMALNTSTPGEAGVSTTTAPVAENEYVYLVFSVTPAIATDITSPQLKLDPSTVAIAADFEAIEQFNPQTNSWSSYSIGSNISCPAGSADWTVRLRAKTDFTTEVAEDAVFKLELNTGSGQVTGSDITHTVQISSNNT